MTYSLCSRSTLAVVLALLATGSAWAVRPGVGDFDPPDATADGTAKTLGATPCVAGMAGSYPCSNIDLLSVVTAASMGGGSGNDIWGWTHAASGREFALVGRTNGTSFVEITDPNNPLYLGQLPTHTSNTSWRDLKVYADHLYIVAEASAHGMQVFDLSQLLAVVSPPTTFSNTAHYSGFSGAHNLAINEDSGYAYAVGSSTCSGGLHMIDLSIPTSPASVGCFSADGYVHDVQCVTYSGPDVDHAGQEICVCSNEDTVTVVDVTNKAAPVQLSRTGYTGSSYADQGWLTEDHRYFLLTDELDENSNGHNTRLYVWDMSDLDLPVNSGNYTGSTAAVDKNVFIVNDRAHLSSYRAGLRVLDISDIGNSNLVETGYFDTYPSSDSAAFDGAWGVYPFFPSGTVIVNTIENGLFVLDPTAAVPVELQTFTVN